MLVNSLWALAPSIIRRQQKNWSKITETLYGMMNGSIVVHTTPWPTASYLMLIRLSNGSQALTGGLEFSNLVAQPLAISSSSLQDMVGSEDIALKLTKIPVYVDSANLPLKTQSIFGPHAGHLMGSGMLFVKNAKRITALFPSLHPLCGQSRNSSGSFEIQKWLSCCLAQGHNKHHCKNWFRLHLPSYVADTFIGDWPSFKSGARLDTQGCHLWYKQTNKLLKWCKFEKRLFPLAPCPSFS